MAFTPLIVAHTIAASGALAGGAALLFMKKGNPVHRLAGRLWTTLMVFTALSSFWIRTTGHFSWIHLLSVVTLVSLAYAIHAAMHGRIRVHRQTMGFNYIGLAIAAAFTLLPERPLGHALWRTLGWA
ncbi:MAG: hypothetical protein K0S28_1294 [Paucimonas sp.]|jgi:uncharacterized membrane protein|nr:hypothetical protein [Paucimonas sp.]